MKFTYMGFSQERLVDYKLDLVDAAILRYFIDFKDSGGMVIEIVDEKPYYWLKYEDLIESNPILNINSKDVLRRRLKKLVDCEILTHHCKKQGGTFSFYGVGDNYKYLLSNQFTQKQTTEKSEGTSTDTVRPKSSRGYDSKVVGGTTQKSEGYDSKVGTKDSSIKHSSIKNTNLLKTHTTEEIENIVCVLEEKVTLEESKELLEVARGDIELIKAKYEIAKASSYRSLIAFMKSAIREDWQMPKKQKLEPVKQKIETKFHNFESRTANYSPQELEDKVLNRHKSLVRG